LLAVFVGAIRTCWTVSSSSINTGCCVIWYTSREIVNWRRTSSRKPGLRVLERGHQYDGRHDFIAWLYAVARNLTFDYLRKKRYEPTNSLQLHADPIDLTGGFLQVAVSEAPMNENPSAAMFGRFRYSTRLVAGNCILALAPHVRFKGCIRSRSECIICAWV